MSLLLAMGAVGFRVVLKRATLAAKLAARVTGEFAKVLGSRRAASRLPARPGQETGLGRGCRGILTVPRASPPVQSPRFGNNANGRMGV